MLMTKGSITGLDTPDTSGYVPIGILNGSREARVAELSKNLQVRSLGYTLRPMVMTVYFQCYVTNGAIAIPMAPLFYKEKRLLPVLLILEVVRSCTPISA